MHLPKSGRLKSVWGNGLSLKAQILFLNKLFLFQTTNVLFFSVLSKHIRLVVRQLWNVKSRFWVKCAWCEAPLWILRSHSCFLVCFSEVTACIYVKILH